jgi:hypothetical protein
MVETVSEVWLAASMFVVTISWIELKAALRRANKEVSWIGLKNLAAFQQMIREEPAAGLRKKYRAILIASSLGAVSAVCAFFTFVSTRIT